MTSRETGAFEDFNGMKDAGKFERTFNIFGNESFGDLWDITERGTER
jgi:hypothetical protein